MPEIEALIGGDRDAANYTKGDPCNAAASRAQRIMYFAELLRFSSWNLASRAGAPDQRWQAAEPGSETSPWGATNTSRTFLASSSLVKGFWRNAESGFSPPLWTIGLSV